jgi:hypothetical protein
MGKTQNTGNLTNAISQDASNNIGIGGAPSGSDKFEVTGTGKFSGALTGTSASFSALNDFINNTAASTTTKFIRIGNTSGDMAIGVEGSTPTQIAPGSGGIAYSTVLKTVGSTSLILGTNSVAALTFNGSTQAATFSGDVILPYSKSLAFNSISNQYITADASNLYLGTANFARLTISTAGASTFSSGIGIGGATATTGGIQFPATQVAIASANNLDDYEEGTWTPGLKFGASTAGITYSAQSGTYTKIGRQVTVNGYFSLSNKGAAAGQAVITGLPFTIANTAGNYAPATLRFNIITYTGTVMGLANINDTTIGMEQVSEAGTLTDITNTNFANTSSVILSLTYFV